MMDKIEIEFRKLTPHLLSTLSDEAISDILKLNWYKMLIVKVCHQNQGILFKVVI